MIFLPHSIIQSGFPVISLDSVDTKSPLGTNLEGVSATAFNNYEKHTTLAINHLPFRLHGASHYSG
ncbi:hypothetical protein IMPERIA75_360060 [Imperialibacter sp. 75]|nr:hypothetical protein IMPERIA75_360060 [Imperialibacter sp. 75]